MFCRNARLLTELSSKLTLSAKETSKPVYYCNPLCVLSDFCSSNRNRQSQKSGGNFANNCKGAAEYRVVGRGEGGSDTLARLLNVSYISH